MKIVAGLVSLFFSTQLLAQQAFCLPHEEMAKKLNEYSEVPLIVARTSSGENLIFFGNEKTESWTIIILVDDKSACAVAAGDGFKTRPTETKESMI